MQGKTMCEHDNAAEAPRVLLCLMSVAQQTSGEQLWLISLAPKPRAAAGWGGQASSGRAGAVPVPQPWVERPPRGPYLCQASSDHPSTELGEPVRDEHGHVEPPDQPHAQGHGGVEVASAAKERGASAGGSPPAWGSLPGAHHGLEPQMLSSPSMLQESRIQLFPLSAVTAPQQQQQHQAGHPAPPAALAGAV